MPRLLARPEQVIVADRAPSPDLRHVHPWAWWLWALSVAVAASLTNNLLVLLLLAAALVGVSSWRRRPGPWTRSIAFYLALAGVVVVLRVAFRIVFGGGDHGQVLFRLPELVLPAWAAGISFGGAVTVPELLWTLTDASRLAVMILAVGAAMTLADPRTALRSVPPALHDISVAVVITLTVLPQLVSSIVRINRGRRLRGNASRGLRAVPRTLVPVLEDAVEGAMTLATSMEVRGYGRTRDQRPVPRRITLAVLASLVLLVLGVFLLLGVPSGTVPGIVLLGAGAVVAAVALRRSGRLLAVTRYRPAPWGLPENELAVVAACVVAAMIWLTGPWSPVPASDPSTWPTLAPVLLIVPMLTLSAGVVGRPR